MVSITHLVDTDDTLHDYIDAFGIRPMLSYLVDYGYRCRYQGADWSSERFRRVARAYWADGRALPPFLEPVAFVHDSRISDISAFSEHAVVPAANPLFPRFGERHFDYRDGLCGYHHRAMGTMIVSDHALDSIAERSPTAETPTRLAPPR